METLAKSDAFFFITSIAVVLFTLIGLVILFYVVRLVRNIQYISKKIKEESDNVSEDIALIREQIRDQGIGTGIGTLFTLAKTLFSSKKRKSATKAREGNKAAKSKESAKDQD